MEENGFSGNLFHDLVGLVTVLEFVLCSFDYRERSIFSNEVVSTS